MNFHRLRSTLIRAHFTLIERNISITLTTLTPRYRRERRCERNEDPKLNVHARGTGNKIPRPPRQT